MAEPAPQQRPDGEAVPEPVRHEEKTVEVPAVPEHLLVEQDTVPVRSSLDKMLRHEVLRQRSARDDD
jgi:hypothetical protein